MAWPISWIAMPRAPQKFTHVLRSSPLAGSCTAAARSSLISASEARWYVSVAPRSFDCSLAATPLDSHEQRMALYHAVAEALTDQGYYVGGVRFLTSRTVSTFPCFPSPSIETWEPRPSSTATLQNPRLSDNFNRLRLTSPGHPRQVDAGTSAVSHP